MNGGTCPRCGSPKASAEFLAEVMERAAAASAAEHLLEAVRQAPTAQRGEAMARIERAAPGIAAALACYVGTCGVRSAAPAR